MSLSSSAASTETLSAHALLLGRHLDLRRLESFEHLATNPLVVAVADTGRAVLMRSGAIVFFGVPTEHEAAFIERSRPLIKDPVDQAEQERLEVLVDAGRLEGVERDHLVISDGDVARLQVVADILAKSVLLAAHEARVASAFDRIEPLADRLRHQGRGAGSERLLIRHIGETLAIHQDMVGRGEVGDKPEVIWERPDLERLFLNLEAEYEIRERQIALERKLSLINDTAGTLLDLLQTKRSLRVEWYIVLLIVAEIALTLYELFLHPS